MASDKVHIVGIGDDGLEGMTAQALKVLESAEVLIGPEICRSLLTKELAGRLDVAKKRQQRAIRCAAREV